MEEEKPDIDIYHPHPHKHENKMDIFLNHHRRIVTSMNIFFGLSLILWIPALIYILPKTRIGFWDWVLTVFILLYPVIVLFSIIVSRILLFRQRFIAAFYYSVLPFVALVPGIFFMLVAVVIFFIEKFFMK